MVAKNDESKPHSRLVNTVGSPVFHIVLDSEQTHSCEDEIQRAGSVFAVGVHRNDELRSSLGLYETKDEVTHRQELLESLQNLVRESVKQILKNQVSLRGSDESRMHLQISRRRSWRTSSRLVRSEWASTSPVPISIRRVG